MIPHDVGKILVVRLSARGDVAFASPLAGALRRRYPRAHIAWVAEDGAADVIRHNPRLDEVIVLERGAWRRMLRGGRWGALAGAVTDFFGALRERRFDVAIDAQGLLRSGLVTFLSGAPVRIGLGSREGSSRLMTAVVERGGDPRAISSEYRYLAAMLGLGADPFPMEIPRSRAEVAAVERVIEEEGLQEGFVVACPFTTRFYKHWLEERWSVLISAVRERTGLGVVLLGGPGDRVAADRIVRAPRASGSAGLAPAPGPAPAPRPAPLVDLVGRTTLGEASAVVSRCRVLVGVDTGLSHMAHAYDRPAVLIFGSNTPYL
ncbi:MAG: glycosyltransferase family 9 protein, partial [Gemmatimonadetes bacterium]|nr:glycosyltransferase family 9 protein [Gemmatimonadota bacterium]